MMILFVRFAVVFAYWGPLTPIFIGLIIALLLARNFVQTVFANMIAIAIQTFPVTEMHATLDTHSFGRFDRRLFGVVHDLGLAAIIKMRPMTEPAL